VWKVSESVSTSTSKYYTVFVKFLRTFGEFLRTLGELEKETGKSIDEITKEFTNPETFKMLTDALPKELLGELFRLLISIATIRIKKIDEMTPGEKIEVGNQLIEYSNQLEKFMKEVERWLSEHAKTK